MVMADPSEDVVDKLKEYWKEFLLISISSTGAATHALQLLRGSPTSIELLKQHRCTAHRHQTLLVNPLIHREIGDQDLSRNTDFFGDFYSLNKSFLPAENERCDLDVERLEEFLGNLLSIIESGNQGEEMAKEIFDAIKRMAEELQTVADLNPESFVDGSQIRFVMILSGLPIFDSFPPMSHSALSELHRFVSKLTQNMKMTLRDRHVAMSQQLITLQILQTVASDGFQGLIDRVAPVLRHALGYLKLLFEANLLRKERLSMELFGTPTEAMEVHEFYNDAINSTDGMTWTDFIQHQRQSAASCDFQLLEHPFVLDAATKSWYFLQKSLLSQEMQSRGSIYRLLTQGFPAAPYLILKVRREEIVHDALRKLTATVAEFDLKKPLKVVFDDEEGVDEGGVTKEFFQLLVEKLFNADYGMFDYDDESRVFWFNGNSLESSLQFELIGVVLGLAIYNGVILDLHFPLCVYKKLLNVPVGINDLAEFKPAIANSLRQTLKMSAEDLQSSALTFGVEIRCFGHVEEHPLGDHDKDDAVTLENRREYVQLYLKWFLEDSIEPQFRAFHRGFMKCCGDEYLRLFQPEELLLVICGSPDFDLVSLESAAKYQDGYTKESQTVREFWDIAHSLSDEDKKKLLFFVTGSDRVPIRGLSSLQFVIGRHGSDTDRLPTAHTCFNYLLLPDYQDKEKLRRLLSLALEHHTGFGLR